jgi:TatD DNase family protein
VETDAPYLTPEPMRKQKTNEPALVIHVARLVAEIKGMDYTAFDQVAEKNATAFFGW